MHGGAGQGEAVRGKPCIKCGKAMKEGMLPGWWLCPGCGMFLDIQEAGRYQLVRYAPDRCMLDGNTLRRTGLDRSVEVPRWVLLVLSWEPA